MAALTLFDSLRGRFPPREHPTAIKCRPPNSLAGGSAYNDRLLVLNGQNVLNFLLPGRADDRLPNLLGL
jgi:hypothetical protein